MCQPNNKFYVIVKSVIREGKYDLQFQRFDLIPVNLKSYPLEKLLHFLETE
jgi:hypothetical protein